MMNVAAPLPDLSLEEEAIITVDAGDSSAVISQLVIHFTQDLPALSEPVLLLPPMFGYVTTNGAAAA